MTSLLLRLHGRLTSRLLLYQSVTLVVSLLPRGSCAAIRATAQLGDAPIFPSIPPIQPHSVIPGPRLLLLYQVLFFV